MNDFTILHLSDLHINSTGKKLSLLMENLLKDIESEMRFSEHILIMVTGDIVNQAQYKYKENVLEFFRRLKQILGNRVEHIYIVPGNHDRKRNILDNKILDEQVWKSVGKETLKDIDFYPDFWKYIRMSFDEYTDLVREIYKLYYDEAEVEKRCFRDTFGVQIDKVNGKNICVLQFNTAWSSLGNQDERNLKIGQFQIDNIKESFRIKCEDLEKNKEKVDLTIVMAHHPVGWLLGKEEDLLQGELLSNNSFNANVYLCGHTHNRDVINWQNNRHSLTTLVSGIGWPDGSSDHPYAHTYSSYVFNLDVNSIDVYVRSSNDALTFEPDFRIYTQKRNKEENKIIMPINICSTQAYVNLSTVADRSSKACYITEDIIKNLKNYMRLLENIRCGMSESLFQKKLDLYELMQLSADNTEKQGEELYDLEEFWFKMPENVQAVECLKNINMEAFQSQFSAYLQSLCSQICKGLQEFGCDDHLRVHFRKWDSRKDQYIQCCIYGNNSGNYVMSPIDWGQLIEKAFESKRPLIASVNAYYCKESIENNNKKDSGNKWKDFITVIPDFEQNYYIERNPKSGKILRERPLLTFGITIYREEDRTLLYLLDCLEIDKMIGEVLHDFLYYMPIDLKQYVDSNN